MGAICITCGTNQIGSIKQACPKCDFDHTLLLGRYRLTSYVEPRGGWVFRWRAYNVEEDIEENLAPGDPGPIAMNWELDNGGSLCFTRRGAIRKARRGKRSLRRWILKREGVEYRPELVA